MENVTKKPTLEDVPSFLLSLSEKFDQVLLLLSNLNVDPPQDPFGDFKWLAATCQGVPSSTLRIKSAAGEIPGVVKFGKRVLYEKVVVLDWLRSQSKQPVNATLIERQVDEQISQQLGKRGGARA